LVFCQAPKEVIFMLMKLLFTAMFYSWKKLLLGKKHAAAFKENPT